MTIEQFRAILSSHRRPPRYWIAFSGGVDSHVLLHLCTRLRAAEPHWPEIRAVHVHHGLRPEAEAWAGHCEKTCHQLLVPFTLLRVDARAAPGESPEEAARRARYKAIGATIGPGDVVLTAQHADDQAETLLLQLVRGAGIAGLAAMPAFAEFPPGFLLRPLLGETRSALKSYADEYGLKWIEDPSNSDTGYDRNFIRHRVLPVLQRRWPSASRALARSAGHCAEALLHLEDLSGDLYHVALNADGRTLNTPRLGAIRPADQRLVLRHWLRRQGFRMPSAAVIERILNEVLPAASDRMPCVTWREGEIRRHRDALFVLPPLPTPHASAIVTWDGASPLILPHETGELHVTPPHVGAAIDAGRWRKGPISVRFRQGGERLRLTGRAGSHPLKKLFQEAGIPTWLRDRAPLVYVGEELAAVADWWVAEPFAATPERPALSLFWKAGFR